MGVKETVFGLPPFTLLAGEKYPDIEVMREQAGSPYTDAVAIESVAKLAERNWMDKLISLNGLRMVIDRFRGEE